jgi:baculoviral IAP repeat-containing protein 6
MNQLFLHLQKNCSASLKLKEITLRVLLHLIQYDGAITKQQGPIDAQSKFILEILKYNFLKTDLCVAMSIIESVSHLVYSHITNDEKISCQKSSESNNTTNNVFGSLFATVLGSETSQSKTVTDTTLLVNLLKLASILVNTKVPQPGDVSILFSLNLSNFNFGKKIIYSIQHFDSKKLRNCFGITIKNWFINDSIKKGYSGQVMLQ